MDADSVRPYLWTRKRKWEGGNWEAHAEAGQLSPPGTEKGWSLWVAWEEVLEALCPPLGMEQRE